MTRTLAEFNQLVDAEQYFEFFNLPYDPQIVNVNRLHILQKFSQNVKAIEATATASSEAERLSEFRAALEQAYGVFLTSNAVEQKLFKVFNEKPQNIVLLSELNAD
jgi:nitrogenase-stabilizing/protective protein